MLGPSRRSGACFVSLSLSSPSTASPSSIGLVGACEGSNICVLFVCVCVCVGGGGGGGGGTVGEKCGCDMYESNVHIIKHWNTLPYFQQQPHPLHKRKTQTKQKPANSSGFVEVIMYTPISPRERSSVSVSADIGFIPRSCISPIPRPPPVPIPGHGQSHSQTKCQA